MPKRQSVKRFDASKVQGEGAYVIVSGVKVREIRELRKHAKDESFDDFEGGVGLLAKHVVKWNFVDDEEKPLPSPKEDPTVIDELTNEEVTFLVDLLMGESGESGNSKAE